MRLCVMYCVNAGFQYSVLVYCWRTDVAWIYAIYLLNNFIFIVAKVVIGAVMIEILHLIHKFTQLKHTESTENVSIGA